MATPSVPTTASSVVTTGSRQGATKSAFESAKAKSRLVARGRARVRYATHTAGVSTIAEAATHASAATALGATHKKLPPSIRCAESCAKREYTRPPSTAALIGTTARVMVRNV